jgi:hypothetical protein
MGRTQLSRSFSLPAQSMQQKSQAGARMKIAVKMRKTSGAIRKRRCHSRKWMDEKNHPLLFLLTPIQMIGATIRTATTPTATQPLADPICIPGTPPT